MVGKRLQAAHKRFELHFVHKHDDFILYRTHRSHLLCNKILPSKRYREPALGKLLQSKQMRQGNLHF